MAIRTEPAPAAAPRAAASATRAPPPPAAQRLLAFPALPFAVRAAVRLPPPWANGVDVRHTFFAEALPPAFWTARGAAPPCPHARTSDCPPCHKRFVRGICDAWAEWSEDDEEEAPQEAVLGPWLSAAVPADSMLSERSAASDSTALQKEMPGAPVKDNPEADEAADVGDRTLVPRRAST